MTTGGASAVTAMLTARSIALVGASARPGSLGERMVTEVRRSTGTRRVHLVNPRHDRIGGVACVPSLREVDGPVDLALLAVGDAALDDQLAVAAMTGVRAAVIFGSAHGDALRASLRRTALDAGMAVCGAGCMGFVNVADGLRATGYVERAELPRGPITLVAHSGSVFSALLRTRRALGYTLAVSSGQELVTTTADYLEHALEQTGTRAVALVLEAIRDGPRLVTALRRAADRDIPVVVLPVGGSPLGSALVTAHSGALAGSRAAWEAVAEGTGALLVDDLAELTDTLELLTLRRRPLVAGGLATVHDSGAERTLVADLAETLDVSFAPLAPQTSAALQEMLDDGLVAANPLDLWGRGAATRSLFGSALTTMAADPSVTVVALAVDLVQEYDGDTSYPDAVLDAAAAGAPVVVLANLPAALDQEAAARLRAAGVPVLEGTRSGLVALRHLLARPSASDRTDMYGLDTDRQGMWLRRLGEQRPLRAAEAVDLLADYGVQSVGTRSCADLASALAAADELGWPVVLKTDEPAITHKSDVGGVVLGVASASGLTVAYADLAARLGPRVSVSATAPPGVELALGIVRDPELGPLLIVAAGGVLTELLADRAVGLPPVSAPRALRLLDGLRARPLLDGWRGGVGVDTGAVVDAVVAVGRLAAELGESLDALDVNPLIVSASGAVAVDALVVGWGA